MTKNVDAPPDNVVHLRSGEARRIARGSSLGHAALGLAGTVLHYAGHHAGQTVGCLIPLLHHPALEVCAAGFLLAASIYVGHRPPITQSRLTGSVKT